MIEQTTPTPNRPLPPRWSFGDLLLIAVWSVLAILVLSVGITGLLFLLGNADPGALVAAHPVLTSVILGGMVYAVFFFVIYLRLVRRPGVGWRGIGFRRPPIC